MILVDTNIPLRLAQLNHPHRQPALEAITLLTVRENEHFAIAPQSLYEMYVVCTRPPAQNGFGMAPEQAIGEITATRGLFRLVPETTQVYSTWEQLLRKYPTSGKRAHDARIVAMMIEHRIAKLLTFNDEDFRRYKEIEAINPLHVLQ